MMAIFWNWDIQPKYTLRRMPHYFILLQYSHLVSYTFFFCFLDMVRSIANGFPRIKIKMSDMVQQRDYKRNVECRLSANECRLSFRTLTELLLLFKYRLTDIEILYKSKLKYHTPGTSKAHIHQRLVLYNLVHMYTSLQVMSRWQS